MNSDTIIALSSPTGVSGLAVIRATGPEAKKIISTHLTRNEVKSHQMTFGNFSRRNKEKIDSLNYVFMEGPKTSTGEDVLEIFPHGNPLIIRQIIDEVLQNDFIRMAEPGEFTRRAMENGKLDLIQAEAVGQIIHAENKAALKNAQNLLQGKLSKPLQQLKTDLNTMSVQLELDVDFVEEESQPDYQSWNQKIQSIKKQLNDLCQSWEHGQNLNMEPKVAFFGKPNAGKSSLINSIIKSDRLIVSEQPGTTRDYVEIPTYLKNGKVIFIDTAGLGEAIDKIDNIAMNKTRNLFKDVQYKVLLIDGTDSEHRFNKHEYDLILYTKKDLPGFGHFDKEFQISNVTGSGIDSFLKILNEKLFVEKKEIKDVYVSSKRQYECLRSASTCIQKALEMIEEDEPAVELLAFELREAHNKLSELIGEYQSEEVLNQLFSGFCIGK